jgi:hypothetical protein
MTVAVLFNGIKQLHRFWVVSEQTMIVSSCCSQDLRRALLRQLRERAEASLLFLFCF